VIAGVVRISMNLAEFFIAVGFAFAAGFFAGIWVRR
jgi:hypothetical protein